METKSAMGSMTIWGAVGMAAAFVLQWFGADASPDTITEITGFAKNAYEWALGGVALVSTGLTIIGRLRAKTAIGSVLPSRSGGV